VTFGLLQCIGCYKSVVFVLFSLTKVKAISFIGNIKIKIAYVMYYFIIAV